MTKIIKFNDFIKIMEKNTFYDYIIKSTPLPHTIMGKKYDNPKN